MKTSYITGKDFVGKNSIDATLILVDDPYTAFTALLEEYHKYKTFAKNGVEQPSYIGENSTIGENHYRAAFSYIGNNVTIGTNVKIYASASIGDNVTIGNNTIIYAGVNNRQ
jgi:UDP-3-O-[3-hydroxymyristoyl] glucosamine N-acyltransferase